MSAKPPPPPKRGTNVRVVTAIYPYSASKEDEVSFHEGDILYIHECFEDGWWRGTVNGKTGLIPSNYVEDSTETINFPLHEAAKRGNVDFLNECLVNRVSVNTLDKSGSTPLHWASRSGNEKIVQILLNIPNVQIDCQNKLGDTPLHNAVLKGNVEVIRLLLDRSPNILIPNKSGKTPLDLARSSCPDPEAGALVIQFHRNSHPIDESAYDEDESADSD